MVVRECGRTRVCLCESEGGWGRLDRAFRIEEQEYLAPLLRVVEGLPEYEILFDDVLDRIMFPGVAVQLMRLELRCRLDIHEEPSPEALRAALCLLEASGVRHVRRGTEQGRERLAVDILYFWIVCARSKCGHGIQGTGGRGMSVSTFR